MAERELHILMDSIVDLGSAATQTGWFMSPDDGFIQRMHYAVDAAVSTPTVATLNVNGSDVSGTFEIPASAGASKGEIGPSASIEVSAGDRMYLSTDGATTGSPRAYFTLILRR